VSGYAGGSHAEVAQGRVAASERVTVTAFTAGLGVAEGVRLPHSDLDAAGQAEAERDLL
jgi:hypothetical protein